MLTLSTPGHQTAPAGHPWTAWHKRIYLIQLILEEWYSFQKEGDKYRFKEKLLHIPCLGFWQLVLDVHLHGLYLVEDRRSYAVNSIKEFQVVISCSTWDPATPLIVNIRTISVKSCTLEISVFPLLDFMASRQCSESKEHMLTPIGFDPYKFTGSLLWDSPVMKYISKVSNSSFWPLMTKISRLMS